MGFGHFYFLVCGFGVPFSGQGAFSFLADSLRSTCSGYGFRCRIEESYQKAWLFIAVHCCALWMKDVSGILLKSQKLETLGFAL